MDRIEELCSIILKDINNKNNFFETQYVPTWANSYQSAVGMQIFDSNLSVALHIEGKEENDGFRLVGIEFKELLNDF